MENNRRFFQPFLADTWWFGMTARCSDEDFLRLVKKRSEQGFTAAQIVVGIPPEVGIYNENALSPVGGAFNLRGVINNEYLNFAKGRIKLMNEYGLVAIIYGGWGYQIDWISTRFVKDWWSEIIDTFDNLDVIYCLSGESDMWSIPFMSKTLLPNKSSYEVHFQNSKIDVWQRILRRSYRLLLRCYGIVIRLSGLLIRSGKECNPESGIYSHINNRRIGESGMNGYIKSRRRKKWSGVLEHVHNITKKPIFIHTTPEIEGFVAVNNHELLAANTFQTGHRIESLDEMWQLTQRSKSKYPKAPTINLEPFYEGIHNQFFLEEQLQGFWRSVVCGNYSICYGAHGIWNVGDGEFLSHWGNQTFDEALKLETPYILGKSFKMLLEEGVFEWDEYEVKVEDNIDDTIDDNTEDNIEVDTEDNPSSKSKISSEQKALSMARISGTGRRLTYIPNVVKLKAPVPKGKYFDVCRGEFVDGYAGHSQLVVLH